MENRGNGEGVLAGEGIPSVGVAGTGVDGSDGRDIRNYTSRNNS